MNLAPLTIVLIIPICVYDGVCLVHFDIKHDENNNEHPL